MIRVTVKDVCGWISVTDRSRRDVAEVETVIRCQVVVKTDDLMAVADNLHEAYEALSQAESALKREAALLRKGRKG